MSNWHIDGWDRLGGRAFATQREYGRDLVEESTSSGPTVYIGPPGFRPEVLASSTVALSACRFGEFLPRVPNEEAQPELGFPSVEAVAEFVRRGFVSGGRDQGGGGDLAPAPDDAGPVNGPELEGTSFLAHYSSDYVHQQKFVHSTGGKDVDDSLDALPLALRDTPGGTRHHAVSSGGALLVASMLAHRSALQFFYNAQDGGEASIELCRALGELDLWYDWIDTSQPQETPSAIRHFLQRSVHRVFRSTTVPYSPDVAWIPLLLSRTRPLETLSEISFWYARKYPFPLNMQCINGARPHDRYEALYSWPLPPMSIFKALRLRSAGQLLSLFLASPASLDKAGCEIYDILEFCGALLSSRTTDRSIRTWREDAAHAWFDRSRPQWAFSNRAENLLLGIGTEAVLPPNPEGAPKQSSNSVSRQARARIRGGRAS